MRRRSRGTEWEFGISRHKLLYTGQTDNVLLHSTGSRSIRIRFTINPAMNHHGREYETRMH